MVYYHEAKGADAWVAASLDYLSATHTPPWRDDANSSERTGTMSTANPNAPVKLRNGAEAPESTVKTTMLALRRLEGGDVNDVIALYELREIARDRTHEPWGASGELLKSFGLLDEGGRLHDATRNVVLSAVAGDVDIHLVGPLAEEQQS